MTSRTPEPQHAADVPDYSVNHHSFIRVVPEPRGCSPGGVPRGGSITTERERTYWWYVPGISDIAVFHGTTVDALETAFHETLDHYLEVSERTGTPAQKPVSGNLMLRIPPEVHAAVALAAELEGTSINRWAARRPSEAARS